MEFRERLPIYLRILLFCVLLGLLGLWPHARDWANGLQTARLAAGQGRFADAGAALRQAAAYQPWRADLWEQAGKMDLAAGKPVEAAAAFEQALQRGSLSVEGRLAYGEALNNSGDTAGALTIWQALMRDFPNANVYEQIYRLQRSNGDWKAGLETLQAWARIAPDQAEVHYQRGLLLLFDDSTQAVEALEQAAALDGRYLAQVEVIRGALRLGEVGANPGYQKLLLGRALASLDAWDLASAFFEQAVQLVPEYAEGWAFLGEARQHLGQSGYADLERASKLQPDSVAVQALFSIYWRRQGRADMALEGLKKMIQQEPLQAIWQVEAGTAAAESGDLVAALAYYQNATHLEPGNPLVWKALARFSIDYDADVEQTGLSAARTALALAEKDAEALDLMGQAFFKLGDQVSAERFLQRALQIEPNRASVQLHLGQVYLQRGRFDLAYGPLKTAVQLDTDGSTGGLAQRLLEQYFPPGS